MFVSCLSFISDQNFYYQSPQRFQPTFQNPRNGFFPSNGVPGVPPGLVGNLPRNPLGAYQEQTIFGDNGGHRTNEDTTSEYFQYSPFPVSAGVLWESKNNNNKIFAIDLLITRWWRNIISKLEKSCESHLHRAFDVAKAIAYGIVKLSNDLCWAITFGRANLV